MERKPARKKSSLVGVRRDKKGRIQPKKVEMLVYAKWLAFPVDLRYEVWEKEAKAAGIEKGLFKGTDKDFIRMFHVCRDTLWQWRQQDEFWEIRDRFMYAEQRKSTSGVLRSLTRTAMMTGRAAEVNSYMKIVEKADVPNDKAGKVERIHRVFFGQWAYVLVPRGPASSHAVYQDYRRPGARHHVACLEALDDLSLLFPLHLTKIPAIATLFKFDSIRTWVYRRRLRNPSGA